MRLCVNVCVQVITLEGWVEIMYYVMDAHSFYNFIYFILLIIVSDLYLYIKSVGMKFWCYFFVVDACLIRNASLPEPPLMARTIEIMYHPLSLILYTIAGGLGSIPGHRVPIPNRLICMSLYCGKKPK